MLERLADDLAIQRSCRFEDWGLLEYRKALSLQLAAQARKIEDPGTADQVFFVQHPNVYTLGRRGGLEHLVVSETFLKEQKIPVIQTDRGGTITYHGPGQRVAYVMLDLRHRGGDLRRYVHDLEDWLIRTLARFNVKGERRAGRVGIWIARDRGREDKIAAIGVRVRRWVAYHGIALNVDPDLGHFEGIVPCGVRKHGVTSLVDLGLPVTLADADVALQAAFEEVFGLETVTDA